jgi:hypothetical protein
MGFNFPNSPTVNQIYIAPGGPTYTWDGTVWKMTGTSGVLTADSYNRVVNGAMQHSQEQGNTASGANVYYAADQWSSSTTLTNTFGRVAATNSQDYYLSNTFNTAKPSLAAGDIFAIEQRIEGSRLADFRWGTASAKQIVLRFESLCSVGGTFSVAVRGGGGRSWLGTFTLPVNQWTTVNLIIPGDTGGTWVIDTGSGLILSFTYACGSSLLGSAGWNTGGFLGVTGMSNAAATTASLTLKNVGLYLDPNSTGVPPPWVTPDYASELQACKRYWEKNAAFHTAARFSGSTTAASGNFYVTVLFSTSKRVAPAMSLVSTSAIGFPATSGSGSSNEQGFYESRIANAVTNAALFSSDWIANARM